MRALILPVFTLGVMSWSGCLTGTDEIATISDSDEQPPPPLLASDAAPDSDTAGGVPRLGPTYTEAALWPHGGEGGGYTDHVTPPAVIYGVYVRTGVYVDNIAFSWYQPTSADNLYRTGDNWGWTQGFGGGGGSPSGWWNCPAGQGVIGIRGNSGTLVDRIGVICGDVNNPDPTSTFVTYSPLWGGGGGGWFDDRCGRGRLVDSFNLRTGALVDNIQAICIDAH